MDLGLSGKRVLLTGATRGIGRAILEAFLIEGAHVAFCARGQAGIDALMAAHPARAKNLRGRALDVRDADAFKLSISAASALSHISSDPMRCAGRVATL